MSRSEEFIANTVVGARLLLEGARPNHRGGSCIALDFTDPLAPEIASSSTPSATSDRQSPTQPSADPGLASFVSLSISVGTVPKKTATPAELNFGAVLAEVLLVYSVLSKQDGPARVPPISTLHLYPVLGCGKSFTARLVPSSSFGNLLPDWHMDENVVVKSLRPREILDTTRKHPDERILHLQNFLRELRVLTHEPLRNHENIARLIGVGWERNRLSIQTSVFHWPFLVIEHAPYGNLSDFLENHAVDFDTRRALCLDVGLGLQRLHECDVIHGDMKLENVLVSRHPTRKYVAKIADFGFTIFDLEGNSPNAQRAGYSEPWEAPESGNTLAFRDRQSTDTYSYGFLIWKCLSYGHYPFDEAGGAISNQSLEAIKKLKATDGVPEYAARGLKGVLDDSLLSASMQALQYTVRVSPAMRSLDSAVKYLMFPGTPLSSTPSSSANPIRSIKIPPEQGLGIYEYGGRNLRLNKQNMDALESHYLYAKQLGEGITSSSHLLILNGAATVFSHYLMSHFAGDVKSLTHPTPTLKSAFLFLQLSAAAQSTGSAEAILPIAKAFDCDSLILDVERLSIPAAYALYRGSEFILRDVMMSEVPGKMEFLDAWALKYCRGAGIALPIPKEIFDGTATRYHEFLSKTFWFSSKPEGNAPHCVIDADFLLQTAAGWGSLADVQLLVREYSATTNSRDVHGETALLKACRAGHVHIVRYLIMEAGAMANIGSSKNVTPLHWLNSFSKEHVAEIAKLLFSAYGDPDAVMDEDFGGSEGEFWFFKGTPLMRVVASGNLPAVNALLSIGANPLISRAGVPGETPLVFAVRRARVDVLKALVRSVPTSLLWERDSSQSRLIHHLLMASPAYLSKVHVNRFEEALVETFDYLWSLVDSETRQFLSIDRAGHIAIQLAVTGGNFILVKRIIDTCPTEGHLKELVATIGMQTAITEGRYAIFKYLLNNGGLALHPVLQLEMDNDSQFEAYVTCGPWTQDLVFSQRKTNSLHLCARAGEHAQMMCEDLLRSILPASRWDVTPETLREQNTVNCSCDRPLEIDPIVDSRNERAETPFFCALQVEEYQMAFALYQAGASQNVTIPHRIVSSAGPYSPDDIDEGLPLVEHVLTWTSAYRALHFMVHFCWGCLRLTSQHGDELRGVVIEETSSWPLEEGSEVFVYVRNYCYPGFTWDKDILHAIKWRNEAVVSVLLRNREELIPLHQQPYLLYDAVRIGLLILQKKDTLQQSTGTRRLSNILHMIKRHFPDHPFGGQGSLDFGQTAIQTLTPEIQRCKSRYTMGLISLHKLEAELNTLLFPWLVCLFYGTGPDRSRPLEALTIVMQGIFDGHATLHLDTRSCQVTLTVDSRTLANTLSSFVGVIRPEAERKEGFRHSLLHGKGFSLRSKGSNSRKSQH